MLEETREVEYLGGFLTASEAYDYLQKEVETVDLIFCDVEMPGNNGLWLAEKIKKLDIQIVFLTNHTGYAAQAFEACALDYILKPINENSLNVMLQKVRYQKKQHLSPKIEQIEEFYNYLDSRATPNRIFINTLSAIIVVKLEEVVYFSSNVNYTIIVLNNGEKQTISKTIKFFEDVLKCNNDFLRVSRFYIVNRNYIKLIKRNKTRQFALTMQNGEVLDTSYKTKEEILEKLSN